jgi:putative Holliday junction resolvase
MPKHMNGDVGIRGQISIDFKEKLLEKGNFNVILWDERLSTVTANRAMLSGNVRREKRKEHKDELAAVVILQGYLDFKR